MNATILAVTLGSYLQVLPSLASNNYFEGELERSRSFGTQLCYYTYDVFAAIILLPCLSWLQGCRLHVWGRNGRRIWNAARRAGCEQTENGKNIIFTCLPLIAVTRAFA